ncbi:hypothetical protein GN958_ATG20542 [Phytophthora infestans]|uniref:BZIP domain-containing protein n=1 Tax=Phytophthora infestans TaxID=4787 RepID=A0A8S9TT56_PHYIN|nr:hypothetical protein GN958_ATG20542 [Phytophthora infestans]
MTTDKVAPELKSTASTGPSSLDIDFLVPEEMELQTGTLADEPLHLNACGVVGHCSDPTDDLDMNFLSDLLPSDSSRVELLSTSNESGDSSPTGSLSSDSADTSSSANEPMKSGRPKRAKPMLSPPSYSELAEAEPGREQERRQTDRKARRRAQVASSARRLRCKKKNERMTLETEANYLEQQLDSLRSRHKQSRANNAVAAWEERAIAQRHKRRQAEKTNEQLRQALFLQSGFVRNLRSMFIDTMPCSIELNMRNFLHTPTRLLKDQRSRVRNLESVCTDAKLDMAKQIIMEETGGIKPFTTPHIACQQIDLGRDGFGMTTVAVYACKTFKATCSAVMNCVAVWPNYRLVNSSSKAADLPPTKLNIRYGKSHNVYESDATGDRVRRRLLGAARSELLVRPEICVDGVERIVCRNICTKVHLVDSSELTPSLERFSKSRQLCAQICGSLVYEAIRNDAATSSC